MERSKANRVTFTELGLGKLKPPASGQVLYWDKDIIGLSLLVSSGRGTKSYRSTFNLHGTYVSRKIGRLGEMSLKEARRQVEADRSEAAKGNDPREAKRQGSVLFGDIVAQFIEDYAKPRQRTWRQTERILKVNCAAWLNRPMASITRHEVETLLRGFKADGHVYKARVTQLWLKVLWRRASNKDLVTEDIMQKVEIDFETRTRDRVYSDAEIKATWNAADKLDPINGAFVKLLILLAPRKTALAAMRRTDLDDPDNPTLWTTPHELTKSKKKLTKKRVYLTPLPPLAQRIIKSLPKGDDRLFPTLPLTSKYTDHSYFHGTPLVHKLVEHGAPADFTFHAWRHTIATWLQAERGYDDWECALVLNHAGSGVTAGYIHGLALKLKLQLLTEWADHVESIVQPKGAALLR